MEMKSHFSKYIRRSKAALLLALTMGAVALASCDDFLDVTPKSQLEEGALFSRESGYDDQLTGVYTQMMGSSMYG
ncbi:MAG: hypothetical protein IKR18_03435, partial [Bacteroidaceae bacterium]|nr:hypothetical protein [Bacteroidaceae bacterium]